MSCYLFQVLPSPSGDLGKTVILLASCICIDWRITASFPLQIEALCCERNAIGLSSNSTPVFREADRCFCWCHDVRDVTSNRPKLTGFELHNMVFKLIRLKNTSWYPMALGHMYNYLVHKHSNLQVPYFPMLFLKFFLFLILVQTCRRAFRIEAVCVLCLCWLRSPWMGPPMKHASLLQLLYVCRNLSTQRLTV